MSEPSKRDRAVEELSRALRRARLSLEPELGYVGLLIDLIVDAAAERVRDEAKSGPLPLREQLRPIADASWARNEAAYRYLARDGKDSHRASQEVFSGTGAEGSGPGCCRHCGTPFELVRPGKSQPTCRCWGREDP